MKMATNGQNVRIQNRSRIAAQNLLEGDEFLLRGEPSLEVESIRRSESKGSVRVSFTNGTTRKFEWGQKVSVADTPERHSFRRNSLRRQGYPNYNDIA